MEHRNEVQEAIAEAEVELKVNRLKLFQNDPQYRQLIDDRIDEILDKVEPFDLSWFDITTQAALAQLLCNIQEGCQNGVTLNDLKLAVALGYVLVSMTSKEIAGEIIEDKP